MHHFNKSFILSLIATSFVFGSQTDILSKNKKETLKYAYEKAQEDANKLGLDWINPVLYKHIYNNGKNYDTRRSTISVSQPVFKSGGIYNAIKYSSSMEKYGKTSVDIQKKELVKQTLNILFEIKKIEITIQKQELLIKNSDLDIQRKQEQVLNGILDTSFLDNAILDANLKKNTLIDLKLQKNTLINNLANFTDTSYEVLQLPTFKLLSNNEFEKKNIYLKQQKQNTQNSYYLKNMVTSQYLPSINLTADYTKYHDTDYNPALSKEGTSNIGFNITIPLDVRFSNDIQSNKISYLQNKIAYKEKLLEEENIFKNALATIDSIEQKIDIAKADITLYSSLLKQMQEQYQAGLKTITDVQTMENSKMIKTLEIKSLNTEKQMQLLEVYSRIEND